MISKSGLVNIISGKNKGLVASITRLVLWGLTPIYRVALALRNRKYARTATAVTKVGVPVISIGNLTTGGTGKSPMVIWVCRQLRQMDCRVAVISRGYGGQREASGTRPNDEALEMQQRLPDVPQLQDPDRIKSANIAIDELETQCLVMDDGFQHRRIHRDLDVVLIDATNPFGYNYLLPRGLLREPVSGLSRADVVVITRCQQADEQSIDEILQVVQQATAAHDDPPVICRTRSIAKHWLQFDGQTTTVDEFGNQPVIACCAIGNPDSFIKNATLAKANIVQKKFFPDHHAFTRADMNTMVQLARASGTDRIVCTHKDLVKIGVNQFEGVSFFALQIELDFVAGQQALVEKLKLLLS